MDFLNALDPGWADFRNKVINEDTTKVLAMPATLAAMFARACAHRGDTGRQVKAAGTVFAAAQLEEDLQTRW